MPCALTKSSWMSKAITTQRLAASHAGCRVFTILLSMPPCIVPAYSLTWWRMGTPWAPTFRCLATGPSQPRYLEVLCCTWFRVIRCGCRWLSASIQGFTPARRQTAPSLASWCTLIGKTLLFLLRFEVHTTFHFHPKMRILRALQRFVFILWKQIVSARRLHFCGVIQSSVLKVVKGITLDNKNSFILMPRTAPDSRQKPVTVAL